jgi:anaerobic magnesium-protoporphyrin IX monomethyl ester cyclase
MDHSPYEILGNNVLTFDEIIRIKQVEDVLEKYWNDHRMDHTVKYLINHVFESPFDFFQEFGTYWETRGWSRIGHQLEDLFKRLIAFLKESAPHALPAAESLMKLDYLERQQFKPRKPWWENAQNKEETSKVLSLLAQSPEVIEGFPALSEKDIYKHAFVTETAIDPLSVQIEQHPEKSYLLIALFDPKQQNTQIFTAPKTLIHAKRDA